MFLSQISPETAQEVLKLTTSLAEKNDRTLFIFLLLFVLGVLLWVIWYYTKTNQALFEKNETLATNFTNQLMTIIMTHNQLQQEFVVKLDRNTQAMEHNTQALGQNASLISELKKKTDSLTATINRQSKIGADI